MRKYKINYRTISKFEKTLMVYPCCKSTNVSIRSREFNVDFYVMCKDCYCRTQLYEIYQRENPVKKAVNGWNGRVNLIEGNKERK